MIRSVSAGAIRHASKLVADVFEPRLSNIWGYWIKYGANEITYGVNKIALKSYDDASFASLPIALEGQLDCFMQLTRVWSECACCDGLK